MIKMLRFLIFGVLFFAGRAALCAQDTTSGPWVMQSSDSAASFRGIHAAGGGVAWASGTDGTVLRTEDSGYMWQSCAMPPGAEKLDFRGIWAWDANTAMVMSSGPGDLSRIYETTDGCSHWTLLYTNPDKDGFWDAVVFSDQKEGYLFGDPVQAPGRTAKEFQTFVTLDSGKTWSRQKQDFYDEMGVTGDAGAFAASNSSMAVLGHRMWLGTGGKLGAYVFLGDRYANAPAHSICSCYPTPPDEIWITHRVPIPLASGTDSAGVFSLAFRDQQHGVGVGGDYLKPDDSAGTAAWTSDGGQHWTAAEQPSHGYRSAVAWDADAKAWIAAGPNGSDISYDDGKTWSPLDNGNWNALSLPWVVGPKGRIAKLDEGRLKRLK
jgi:photosystem II stability/assembly factor-like uncharacterized protein